MTARTGRKGRSHRGRWRVLGGVGLLLVALVAGWLGWAHAVIQTPRADTPARVDAVLVLGGLRGPERTERALAMARDGLTDTLVVSTPGNGTDALTRATCRNPPTGITVLCFRPDPSTTRGEAREIGQLAEREGWDSVAVVTSPYHVSRARMIVGRCFGGRLLVVASQEQISAGLWAYNYVYQTAGYLKAEFLRGC